MLNSSTKSVLLTSEEDTDLKFNFLIDEDEIEGKGKGPAGAGLDYEPSAAEGDRAAAMEGDHLSIVCAACVEVVGAYSPCPVCGENVCPSCLRLVIPAVRDACRCVPWVPNDRGRTLALMKNHMRYTTLVCASGSKKHVAGETSVMNRIEGQRKTQASLAAMRNHPALVYSPRVRQSSFIANFNKPSMLEMSPFFNTRRAESMPLLLPSLREREIALLKEGRNGDMTPLPRDNNNTESLSPCFKSNNDGLSMADHRRMDMVGGGAKGGYSYDDMLNERNYDYSFESNDQMTNLIQISKNVDTIREGIEYANAEYKTLEVPPLADSTIADQECDAMDVDPDIAASDMPMDTVHYT
jgi:hypothetical protein